MRTTLTIPESLWTAVQQAAAREGLSAAAWVRMILTRAINEAPAKR